MIGEDVCWVRHVCVVSYRVVSLMTLRSCGGWLVKVASVELFFVDLAITYESFDLITEDMARWASGWSRFAVSSFLDPSVGCS